MQDFKKPAMAIDLFSANRRVNAVSWYENEGAVNFTRRIVDDDSIQVHTVLGVDLDGDIDLLSASRDAFEVALQTGLIK